MSASFDLKINKVDHSSSPSSGLEFDFRPSSSSSSSSSFQAGPTASSTSSSLVSKVGILRLFDCDAMDHLYPFLGPKELTCFEVTSSLKHRKIQEFFNHRVIMTDTSEWEGTAKTLNPNKWNFLLSQALKDIVMQMKEEGSKKSYDAMVKREIVKSIKEEGEGAGKDYGAIANQLLSRYRYLINLFPRFRCYVYQRFSGYLKDLEVLDLGKERLSLERDAKKPSATTDALLYVSLEIEQPGIYSESAFFRGTLATLVQKAIRNGAAYASELFFHKRRIWDPRLFETMAVLSATTSKGRRNYKALERLVFSYSRENLDRLNRIHPSLPPVLGVFAQLAFENRKFKEADSFCTQAIAEYQYPIDVTPEIWDLAADVKGELGQYRAADERYTQAIKKYEGDAPAETLADAARVKARLRQHIQADDLYTQAIKKYEGDAPAETLADAAGVKARLRQHIQADDLYAQAIKKYKGDVPTESLAKAAEVKFRLRQYTQANELYTQLIEKMGEKNLSCECLVLAGVTQTILAQKLIAKSIGGDVKSISECLEKLTADIKSKVMEYYANADRLFTEARGRYTGSEHFYIWSHSAHAKLLLGRYEEADKLFKQAIDNWKGDAIPHWVLIDAVFTKQKFGYPKEKVDEFQIEIVEKIGEDQMPAFALEKVAELKLDRGQREEADRLYTKALRKYAGAESYLVLTNAAEVKFMLRQYEAADDLYERAIKKESVERLHPNHLPLIGCIKWKLSKYEEADLFYTQAREKCPIDNDLLLGAAIVKSTIGQYREADELFTQFRERNTGPISVMVVEHEASTKLRLGQYEVADELFTQIRSVPGDHLSSVVLEKAAEAKFRLGLYKEAQDIAKQILEKDPHYILDLIKRTPPRASVELKTT